MFFSIFCVFLSGNGQPRRKNDIREKKLSQKVESFSRYERFLLLSKLNFPSINGKVFSVKKAIEF